MTQSETDTLLLHERYKCFGRYMEMDQPWTDSGGGCSQECPRRHDCFQVKKKVMENNIDTPSLTKKRLLAALAKAKEDLNVPALIMELGDPEDEEETTQLQELGDTLQNMFEIVIDLGTRRYTKIDQEDIDNSEIDKLLPIFGLAFASTVEVPDAE